MLVDNQAGSGIVGIGRCSLMGRVANINWVDDRIRSQRIAPRTASAFPKAREISLELIGSRADVRRRGGIIPAWVIFGMIILALGALCVTVTMRTLAQKQTASMQYQTLQQDVGNLRRSNDMLKIDLQRLQNNPAAREKAIESAARLQLNMVRPDEIVVPIE